MVKQLFLIRHAMALPAEREQRDFDRGLGGTGVNQSIILGGYLERLGVEIQAIYTSPALRALETCRTMTDQLRSAPTVITSEEYYEATRNVMVAAVSRLDNWFGSVAIVGHNPSVTQLYEYLTGETVGDFMTGSCAWLEIPAESWKAVSAGMASVNDYYYPGKLNTEEIS